MEILTFIEDINISNQFYFYGNDMIVCQYISTTESVEKKQCHTFNFHRHDDKLAWLLFLLFSVLFSSFFKGEGSRFRLGLPIIVWAKT